MDKDFFISCESKITKLVAIVAMTFVISMMHQYIETPYLASVFYGKVSSGRSVEVEFGKTDTLSSNGIGDAQLNSVNPVTISNTGADGGENTSNVMDDTLLLHEKDSGADSKKDGSSRGNVPNRNSTSENTNISENWGFKKNSSKSADISPFVNPISDITFSSEHVYGDGAQVILNETTNFTYDLTLASPSPPPILSIIPTSPLSTIGLGTSVTSIDIVKVNNMTGKSGIIFLSGSSPTRGSSSLKNRTERTKEVMPLSEMNKLIIQIRESSNKVKQQWHSSSATEKELIRLRSFIENASESSVDKRLYSPLYRNASRFTRSYELMEKNLKVYIYKEGRKPIFHEPVLKGIYASEGWFMKLMENNKNFVTTDPEKAHLFYFPFSSRMLEDTLYVKNSHSFQNLIEYLRKYLSLISTKYDYWNRSSGADHFVVACHDWAAAETRRDMGNCIRALCNSDVTEGFHFGKDVSFPETRVRDPAHLLKDIGGKPASEREILAFFAGSMHGPLRSILLDYWGNGRDADVRVFSRMEGKSYVENMKNSKYCICAKGYEVNSPRVVEAIFYECVPVIISDNFVPPFFEIFDWESFAVFIPEKDVPRLKIILESVPQKRYAEMQMAVRMAQPHFLWHSTPLRYDLFHMTLHSIWYNRVMGSHL